MGISSNFQCGTEESKIRGKWVWVGERELLTGFAESSSGNLHLTKLVITVQGRQISEKGITMHIRVSALYRGKVLYIRSVYV